jgi:hypothetical protein
MNLLAALVDDAGLFPPESLPMPDALTRHRADEAAGHPMLSGRFLCPASRLGELREQSGLQEWSGEPPHPADRGVERRLRLSVILDIGLDGLEAATAQVAEEPRLVLEMIEVPAPSEDDVVAALEALVGFEPAAFLEGPRSPEWVKTLATWNQPGGVRGAKVRCGGARADLFPSSEELAAFVCACFENAVPFKATAGLHSAVRHRDERTGFMHHGFLNLLVGAVRAASRASVDEVAAVLASTDGSALAAAARRVSGRELVLTRAMFRAYGSCSTSEPREEAAALGLLEA